MDEGYKVGNGRGDMMYVGGDKNLKQGKMVQTPGNQKHDMKYVGGNKNMKEGSSHSMNGKFNMKYARAKKGSKLMMSMAKRRAQVLGKHKKKGA